MAVWEISFEFISLSSLLNVMLELTGLNMNDSNLGHCSICKRFKDGNLTLLPTQNLLRTGRSFRTRSSRRGNNSSGMISSSLKSSVSSIISSVTLHSSMSRNFSWTIDLAVEEDNRYFKLAEPVTFKLHKFWNLESVCMFVNLKEELAQCWFCSSISSECIEDSSNVSKLGNTTATAIN